MINRVLFAPRILVMFALLAGSFPLIAQSTATLKSGSAPVLTIAVISDLNGSYGSTTYGKPIPRVITHIADLQPDLVISTGDMVAGQRIRPLLKRPQLQAMWEGFHQNVTIPLKAAGLPLAITAGNHDGALAKKFRLERIIYQEQWQDRVPEVDFIDRSEYPFYYAFEIKNVLFIGLDASIVGPLSAAQFSWLQDLLKRVKGKYRQQLVFSHLPLWPVAQSRERDIIGDPKLESLLTDYGVSLYLSGHHHVFYPGYKDGMRYVSQARLGSGSRKYIGSNIRSERGFTLIEIDADDNINVSGYEASDLSRPIDIKSLPKEIKSRNATLIREDLRP